MVLSADTETLLFHASSGMQVKLLQFVRPQDFDNFRHFVRWRDTTANILLQILQRAAQEPASDDDRSIPALMFLLIGPPALYHLFLSPATPRPSACPPPPRLQLLCILCSTLRPDTALLLLSAAATAVAA